MRNGRKETLIALGGALALLIFAATAPVAAQTGRCYRAEIPASMEIPDGGSHDAGQLKLCLDRKLSPVKGLHRLHIDGFPTGFLASRQVKAEDSRRPGPAYFVFEKVEETGALRLLALVAPDGAEMVSFVFAEPTVRTEWAPGNLTLLLHRPDGEAEGPFKIAMAR